MRKPRELLVASVRFVVPALLAFPLLGTSPVHGQAQPLVSYVLPVGGQRGTTVEVGVRGRYRLSIGQRPYITHIFPLGAKRGTEAEVELWGPHLPQAK